MQLDCSPFISSLVWLVPHASYFPPSFYVPMCMCRGVFLLFSPLYLFLGACIPKPSRNIAIRFNHVYRYVLYSEANTGTRPHSTGVWSTRPLLIINISRTSERVSSSSKQEQEPCSFSMVVGRNGGEVKSKSERNGTNVAILSINDEPRTRGSSYWNWNIRIQRQNRVRRRVDIAHSAWLLVCIRTPYPLFFSMTRLSRVGLFLFFVVQADSIPR